MAQWEAKLVTDKAKIDFLKQKLENDQAGLATSTINDQTVEQDMSLNNTTDDDLFSQLSYDNDQNTEKQSSSD